MNRVLKTVFLSAISVILLSANVSTALASTPYLTASSSGSGYVQLTVSSADSYSRVDLSYRPQGTALWTQITNVGFTDQSGYFSQSVNIGYQGTQMDVYVTVNGQQSPTVNINGSGGGCNTYPYNCGSGLSLSQSNLNLTSGQSSTVTVYGNYNNSVYVSNNTNSSVASATVNGGSINVYGNSVGSTTMTICSYNNSGSCATLYVTVNGNGCNQYNCNNQLTFSQSNVSLNVGQSTYVTVYNSGSNSFYVTGVTNSIVTATVSGSTLTIYGVGAGTANVTVCSSDYISRCGTLYVTVNGGGCNYYNCNGQITFSQSNVNLSTGQSSSVSIYGGNYGSYYVSGNTNSNVVSATISGSNLSIYANSSGSSTLTVCNSGYSSQCSYLYVTVSGNNCGYNGCNNGQITLGQSNVTLNRGQSNSISIYGGSGTYYMSSNSNSGVVSATVSGSTLSLYGNNNGTSTITICGNNYMYLPPSGYNNQCASLYVTVTGGGVLGGNSYSNGTLVNDNGTIYITYKNSKSGFGNYPAFTGLGFRLSNVIVGSTSTLTNTGYIVANANTSHPWGSWVKSGNTIYFAHESGLVPISSYDIFVSNGGNLNLVVTANTYDLQRPILSVMTYGDPRLQ